MKNRVFTTLTISALLTSPVSSASAKGLLTYQNMLNARLGDPGFEYLLIGCVGFNSSYASHLKKLGMKIPKTVIGQYRASKTLNAWFNLKGDTIDNRTEEEKNLFMANFQKPGKDGYKSHVQKCSAAFSAVIEASEQGNALPLSTEGDRHITCLQAKDYEGCMRFGSQPRGSNECVGGLCIVNSKGTDAYGLLKPPIGWRYRVKDNGMIQYLSKPYRVPHRGQEARYVAIKRITRSYQSPESGSSGYIISGSSSTTNCVGYGSSINCSTTGTTPTYVPGKSPKPGGIDDTHFAHVYDCIDDTRAAYKDDRLWISWESYDEKDILVRLLRNVCMEPMEYKQSLPILEINM